MCLLADANQERGRERPKAEARDLRSEIIPEHRGSASEGGVPKAAGGPCVLPAMQKLPQKKSVSDSILYVSQWFLKKTKSVSNQRGQPPKDAHHDQLTRPL
jgi:hypothetical protein